MRVVRPLARADRQARVEITRQTCINYTDALEGGRLAAISMRLCLITPCELENVLAMPMIQLLIATVREGFETFLTLVYGQNTIRDEDNRYS